MKKDELIAEAARLGVDVSECTNNLQRMDAIEAAVPEPQPVDDAGVLIPVPEALDGEEIPLPEVEVEPETVKPKSKVVHEAYVDMWGWRRER
jgi:hypothetical protein